MNPQTKPDAPGRLAPDLPLPPYTHVPGKTPHPLSDPRGHSFGASRQKPAPPDADHWQACRPYLFGIDLFNHGYYWESHETWESLWHACGRSGTTADFLKGLIQLAAAGVKQLEGKAKGVASHARRAAELWRGTACSLRTRQGRYLGLQVGRLIELTETMSVKGWPDAPPVLIPAEA